MAQGRTPLKLAIAGFGAIGLTVARYVDEGRIPGMKVTAVSARDTGKAIRNLAEFRSKPQVLPLHQLADVADIILECAPAAVFEQSARPTVEQGKIFVPLSVGALLNHMDLIERAKETGAKIMVPT
ncbi:MAG: hypothetical protein JKX94_12660, partial [Sneathiella sp.]|nr:hypothetical protein [Sneathiella sp.]